MTVSEERKYEGLPVPGYKPQPQWAVDLVKQLKETEERLLRVIDDMQQNPEIEGRWASIARTHFQEGFMALNRSVFKPTRIPLPEDSQEKSNG